MKLYVAGIQLRFDAFIFPDALQKCDLLINLLPNIMNAAKAKMGDDVIVFIVLQEYALTSTSIPSHIKKLIIKQLQDEAAKYPNLILNTGSILYHSLNEASSPTSIIKRTKITENYIKNMDLLQKDSHTLNEKQHFETITANNNPMYVLHNITHLISEETIKHLKSVPWYERNKLILIEEEKKITNDSVYKIGADDPVKQVIVNANTILDIALLICREHISPTRLTNKKLEKKQPTFQVIVSAAVKPKLKNCLHSAYSVFMDSNAGLSVVVNRNHPKFSNDFEIHAEQYNIIHFNNALLLQSITTVDLKDLDQLILDHKLNQLIEIEALLNTPLPSQTRNDLDALTSELQNTTTSLNGDIQFKNSAVDNQSNTTTSSNLFRKRKESDKTANVSTEHESKLRK